MRYHPDNQRNHTWNTCIIGMYILVILAIILDGNLCDRMLHKNVPPLTPVTDLRGVPFTDTDAPSLAIVRVHRPGPVW